MLVASLVLFLVLRWFGVLSTSKVLLPVTVLHELSHCLVGLVMGKGVRSLSVGLEQDGTAGYYLPRYESPVRIGFWRVGDGLTLLAGPLIPPIVLYYVGLYLNQGKESYVFYFTLAVSVLMLVLSKQKLEWFLSTCVLLAVFYLEPSALPVLLSSLFIWSVLALVESAFQFVTYHHNGDSVLVAKSLFLTERSFIAFPIRMSFLGVYLFFIFKIFFLRQ